MTPVASSQEVFVAGRPDVEPSIDGPVVASTHARTPVHYVIIPASQSIEAHAERAGARADQWRQDVFDDLATGGEVRIIPRETHSHDGAQVGIVGHTFYAEANIHNRRDDALFVHRTTA